MKKAVFLLHTGGTIGMARGPDGYRPQPGHLAKEMAKIATFSDPQFPSYDLEETEPLLDSSQMTPDDWKHIARRVAAKYDEYKGFVILHGTDTMAYTASALAFMFKDLKKPVILTGSQIPLAEIRNDGRENLITSMLIAAHPQAFPEVCVYFNHKLMRGCRTTKVSADSFDAFASPSLAPLARIGIDMKLDDALTGRARPTKPGNLAVQEIKEPRVAVLRLFPGISPQILNDVLRAPSLEGLVLQTYGTGTGPGREEYINVLAEARERKIVIVAVSQCLEGTVQLKKYAAGSPYDQAGVLSGFDMTVEAAATKLAYLLSLEPRLSFEEIKRQMQRNLRGELTIPRRR